jgi:hypothetical protein
VLLLIPKGPADTRDGERNPAIDAAETGLGVG